MWHLVACPPVTFTSTIPATCHLLGGPWLSVVDGLGIANFLGEGSSILVVVPVTDGFAGPISRHQLPVPAEHSQGFLMGQVTTPAQGDLLLRCKNSVFVSFCASVGEIV